MRHQQLDAKGVRLRLRGHRTRRNEGLLDRRIERSIDLRECNVSARNRERKTNRGCVELDLKAVLGVFH